jgi:hypothetical protein
MPPTKKRKREKEEREESPKPMYVEFDKQLIPGLLNHIVITDILFFLQPNTSIYIWTKLRAISRTFKEFTDKYFVKPKYLAFRLLYDHDNWVWWKDEKYNHSSITRFHLNVEENVEYFVQYGGKTYKEKKPLRYVFMSPKQSELTVMGHVYAKEVDNIQRRACELAKASPNATSITPKDLKIWLSGSINKKLKARKNMQYPLQKFLVDSIIKPNQPK